jgi:hypothetical protein
MYDVLLAIGDGMANSLAKKKPYPFTCRKIHIKDICEIIA